MKQFQGWCYVLSVLIQAVLEYIEQKDLLHVIKNGYLDNRMYIALTYIYCAKLFHLLFYEGDEK